MVRVVLVIFAALLLAVPAVAQTPRGAPRGSGRVVPNGRPLTTLRPIVNQVVDLLDDDVQLSSGDVTVWESEPIDTSQFSRIGIRVSGEASPYVECRTEWQFTADDEFMAGRPNAFLGTNVIPGDFGRIDYDTNTPRDREEYPDDPSLRPDFIFFTGSRLGPGDNFGEVSGTRARIVCSIPAPTVTIGDDLDVVTEGEVGDDPSEPTATLSDVKVLLRRL